MNNNVCVCVVSHFHAAVRFTASQTLCFSPHTPSFLLPFTCSSFIPASVFTSAPLCVLHSGLRCKAKSLLSLFSSSQLHTGSGARVSVCLPRWWWWWGAGGQPQGPLWLSPSSQGQISVLVLTSTPVRSCWEDRDNWVNK